MPKNRRRVTSKQVAERAGVSQTTVSFVLNDVTNIHISEETRQRVLQAAEELDYVPDVSARTLASGRSNNIALVLGRPHRQVFIDEYLPNVLTGMSEVTRQRGFRILIHALEAADNPKQYIDMMRGREIDGVILNLRNPSENELQTIIDCTEEGFPIVSINQWHPRIYSAAVDIYGGVRMCVEHLIRLGHKRIACITYGPEDDIEIVKRLNNYRQTLEEAGIPFDPTLVRYGAYDPETGYDAMKSLLEHKPYPSAVFGMNDVVAFGAIKALHESGLRVPQDVAVVGFDGIRLAGFSHPALTTFQAPDIERGHLAAQMLISLINGEKIMEREQVLKGHLVIRDSCGARQQQ